MDDDHYDTQIYSVLKASTAPPPLPDISLMPIHTPDDEFTPCSAYSLESQSPLKDNENYIYTTPDDLTVCSAYGSIPTTTTTITTDLSEADYLRIIPEDEETQVTDDVEGSKNCITKSQSLIIMNSHASDLTGNQKEEKKVLFQSCEMIKC